MLTLFQFRSMVFRGAYRVGHRKAAPGDKKTPLTPMPAESRPSAVRRKKNFFESAGLFPRDVFSAGPVTSWTTIRPARLKNIP